MDIALMKSAHVAGTAETSNGELHAFAWTQTGGMLDLGTLGGNSSEAWAINDAGQAVGSSKLLSGATHPFIWDQTEGMQDLGTLGGARSLAYDINEGGQVVGSSLDTNGDTRAFIWNEALGMQDIESLGDISGAFGINDAGQIAGVNVNENGETRAVLWNPIDRTTPEIVYNLEQSSLWPPNHKMQRAISGISATDNMDNNPAISITVASNENRNGTDDGNTDTDWEIIETSDGNYEIWLRAERSGNGSGRTYTITITAEDNSVNTAEEILKVSVDHDQNRKQHLKTYRGL